QENTHTQNAVENFSAAEESWKPNRELLLNVLRTSQVGAQAEQVLKMPNYEFHLGNFNAHWENKIDLTENQRTRKFATWLIQEFTKSIRPKKQNSPMKTAPARDVNSAWGDAKQYAPATDDIDVGEML
ncbi:hypothetical protein ACTFV2_19045, partial [Acinetobacter baumannii]